MAAEENNQLNGNDYTNFSLTKRELEIVSSFAGSTAPSK